MEHEGQAALFEMGEVIPDAPESPSVTIPEQPEPDKDGKQATRPGKDDPGPAPTGKVVDFAAVREEAGKTKPPVKEATPPNKEGKKPEQPRRGRPPKGDKSAPGKTDPAKKDKATPAKAKPPKRDKMVCTPSSRQRNNLHFTHENSSCIPYGAGCYAASRRSWTSIGVRTPRPRWRRWKL